MSSQDILKILTENAVCAAPMSGVTDVPFRSVMRHFGNHLLWSEMIESDSLSHQPKRFFNRASFEFSDERVVYQILGRNPAEMAEAVHILEDNGVLFADINMGCPAPQIVKKGKGSALMQDPALAMEIVETVKKRSDLPLGVKIRLGFNENNALSFARKMTESGADFITVHGRLQTEMYRGKADWNAIREVKQNLSCPVIGNGDVRDTGIPTGTDGVMVGRFLLGRPWGLALVNGQMPSFSKKEIILEHFDKMLSYYGYKGIYVMRKHLAWYVNSAEFKRQVFQTDDVNRVKQLIKDYFGREI